MSLAGVTNEELLDKWNNEHKFDARALSFPERDAIFPELMRRGLFPNSVQAWEEDAGLYPEAPGLYWEPGGTEQPTEPPFFTGDPEFLTKLLRKKEFLDSRQPPIQKKKGVDACKTGEDFELTATQRFVTRFLSPQCPYNSALLYHGVGVGKTCAAISIAEAYLAAMPRKQVIIVAPRTIQSGFRRTIFDEETLEIPDDDEPNVARGCTGISYLSRTDTLYEKDRAVIRRAVNESIKSRYSIMGYLQFYNYIQSLFSSIPKGHPKERERKDAVLRREFSGRLIIIDEAHNLRDTPGESAEDSVDNPGGDLEATESQAGKKLTPTLMDLLDKAQGTKLVLLTGTPMYNSYNEIIFLFDLLLLNDKKARLSEYQIFRPDGSFVPAGATTPGGEKLLGQVAQAYLSFMRGENPLTFPKRLAPIGTPKLTEWPITDVAGRDISADTNRARMLHLPFVPVSFPPDTADTYKDIVEAAAERGGTGIAAVDEMVQAGNWLFPGEEGAQVRDIGFDTVFEEQLVGQQAQYRMRDPANKWLITAKAEGEDIAPIDLYSPKAAFLLRRVRKAAGVIFVYSRFIKSGGLPLALALEANGYTAWGRDRPLFIDGPLDGKGRQCALCARREKEHTGAKHGKFVPANYILITGRAAISPNNPAAIAAARSEANKNGGQIKIVIGSQVASEGVDFRFVREIYVFDSWYHLNKMEQVLGRGVRTCSHALLDEPYRNCTIYLMLTAFADKTRETADMTMYRTAMTKAIQVGKISRVLKQYAIDCNLNHDAIVVKGLDPVPMIDAQGNPIKADLNDTPMTAVCDWIEGEKGCDYECIPKIDLDSVQVDVSTYDEYAARWQESKLKAVIRRLFEEKQQPMIQAGDLLDMFPTIPRRAIAAIVTEIIGNKSFRIQIKGRNGYLIYRNGYYLFQPSDLVFIDVPLALRVASLPVKRDVYEYSKLMEERKGAIAAVEAPPPVEEGEPTTKVPYWQALKAWMARVTDGTFSEAVTEPADAKPPAKNKDTLNHIRIPADVREETKARYKTSDEERRELFRYGMILWMYEYMTTPAPPAWLTEYKAETRSEAQKEGDRKAFAQAVLEFFWDTNLTASEQQFLVRYGDDQDKFIGREQRVQKGTTEAFRYVDPVTGKLIYICATGRCSEAVVRVFESDAADPINGTKVNKAVTGAPYGFMVPEAKKAVIVFKTNLAPPAAPTTGEKPIPPEEGLKCSNISTIPVHTRMLKDIRGILDQEGYSRLFLYDRLLDEDEIRRRESKEIKDAKEAGRAAPVRTVPERDNFVRNLITATRPCTVKELCLRWLDVLESSKGGGGAGAPKPMRYFYRPVAALKAGHKGRTAKD